MEVNPIRITRIVTESHPYYAYWCETKHGFKADDIITTYLEDPAPDREIFVVKNVIDDHTLCTNKQIPAPEGKFLRKLTTVAEITSKFKDANSEEAMHEQAVREKMRELYLNGPFEGTIEERLLEGYLYNITQEDLTLPPDHPDRKAKRFAGQGAVIISTGKAGVTTYVESCKRQNPGASDESIARTIWIEIIVEGVKMHVSIKDLKVKNLNSKLPIEGKIYEDDK